MIKIDCGCTPRYELYIDLDPNPNGLPVLYIVVMDDIGNRNHIPLNEEAVIALIKELQNQLPKM